jgi:S-adenosylmethionine/arginine decarboxylase-like enzyme
MEPKRFITLDVYSCNKFDKNIILDYARECFGFEEYEEKFFERGMGYGDIA